jgi:hypothetical protein
LLGGERAKREKEEGGKSQNEQGPEVGAYVHQVTLIGTTRRPASLTGDHSAPSRQGIG